MVEKKAPKSSHVNLMRYKHNIQSKEYINENGKSKDKKSIGEKT
jgi:hypothetical protein